MYMCNSFLGHRLTHGLHSFDWSSEPHPSDHLPFPTNGLLYWHVYFYNII